MAKSRARLLGKVSGAGLWGGRGGRAGARGASDGEHNAQLQAAHQLVAAVALRNRLAQLVLLGQLRTADCSESHREAYFLEQLRRILEQVKGLTCFSVSEQWPCQAHRINAMHACDKHTIDGLFVYRGAEEHSIMHKLILRLLLPQQAHTPQRPAGNHAVPLNSRVQNATLTACTRACMCWKMRSRQGTGRVARLGGRRAAVVGEAPPRVALGGLAAQVVVRHAQHLLPPQLPARVLARRHHLRAPVCRRGRLVHLRAHAL